ncbi:precorrin-6y C5,15-methyltransferase (decarboxylating) subunit CbiE [Roseobacteraceae bacterium S113]
MSESPWLSIIGLGEDGLEGLAPASRKALEAAEVVMGPPRHLALVPETGAERVAWPVPFADGLAVLKGFEGRATAVLASGDPFWFGAGSVITRDLAPGAWQAFPGPSCFALMAARLGLPLEQAAVVALHAAPMARLRAHMSPDQPSFVTLRGGEAVAELGAYLTEMGAGAAVLDVFEHLGGPQERHRQMRADAVTGEFAHPVCAAIGPVCLEATLPRARGLDDALFAHDGQITKRPIRAMTLSALAPREGEVLLDIGGGSGSISIEWCLSGHRTRAICVERNALRAATIRANARAFGVEHRLDVIETDASSGTLTEALVRADAVFVGGGLSEALLQLVTAQTGMRLVANAVTLESEALLVAWQAKLGGELMRIETAQSAPIGRLRGWKAAYPVVQWSVVL